MSDRTEKPAGSLTPEQKRALLGELLKEKARQQKTAAPASDGQRALWLTQQASPDSYAYHVSFSARICSPVNVDGMRKVIQAIINRHATLRSTYTLQDDILMQDIYAYQEADFVQVDASTWTEEDLYQHVLEADHQPFQLDSGPLVRWRLFSRAVDNHVFLITAHHIAIDAGSLWIVLEDLRLGMQAVSEGKPVQLPPEPEPYTAWTASQADMMTSMEGERLKAYWQRQLAGDLPVLNLPFDFPRRQLPDLRGDTIAFSLTSEQTHQLKALAARQGVTLYTLMLSIFQVLLHRYTGQDDILVGTPTSLRDYERFQHTVGYFINPVVMRSRIEGEPTFLEVLQQNRETVLNALKHQAYPFVQLVNDLPTKRDPSRSQVFQCVFNLHSLSKAREVSGLINAQTGDQKIDFGGLQLKRYFFPQEEGQFELVLEIIDTGELLSCSLRYQTDIFLRETIERIQQSFCVLVEQILAAPETSISLLHILTEDERHKMLVEWNATDMPFPRDMFLHQLFEAQAARTPAATAVIFGDDTLTYAQLNARANQLANHLRRRGAGPGALVGICMDRSLEMIISIFGVLKSGAAYVPVDPAYPPDRIAWMVTDSGIGLILVHAATRDRLPETSAQTVVVDEDWSAITAESMENLPHGDSTESLAYVIYTSGSTGKPKGSMIPHRAIVSQVTWMQQAFPTGPDDVVMQKASFSFDASVWEAHVPLANGGTLLLADPGGEQDGMYMVAAIQQHRVTKMLMVPSVLQLLVETPGFEKCTSLRYLFVGGEALTMALVRDLRAVNPVQLVNLYGPTETTIDTIYWVCDPEYSGKMAILGQPVGNTRVYTLDAHLQPVPVGVTGELHTGGAQVGKGYLGRPELTAERFINDPFDPDPDARLYKTGDLVRYRPDGLLEYLGRNDSQVKIRGFRIELGEIEAVLSQHPGVQGAVVTVREDSGGEKRLAAYIVPREGPAPSVRDLRAYLKDRLPAYMIPSYFVTLDEFPITASGKVDRRALPAPERSGAEAQRELQPPVTEIEQRLAQIWRDLLKVEQINLFDNFFDLGGHSLLAMRLVARVQAEFAHRIDPAFLRFENLGQLAARLEMLQSQGVQ